MASKSSNLTPDESAGKGYFTIEIKGDLLQNTLSSDYWNELSDTQKSDVEASAFIKIDLANVERIDTAGLAWLVNLIAILARKNIKFKLKNLPDQLLNLAALSNAKSILTNFT